MQPPGRTSAAGAGAVDSPAELAAANAYTAKNRRTGPARMTFTAADRRRRPVARPGEFYPGDIDAAFYPGIISDVDDERTYTAFAGDRLLLTGTRRAVAQRVQQAGDEPILVFDDRTGQQVELGAHEPAARPGRPRLGVTSREVSLLPRHWEWLEQQPNGISAALRRLVEEAIRRAPDEERARQARDATSRVMTSLAGDLPGFEEAARALFARDGKRFEKQIRRWPADIRRHLARMAAPAFAPARDEDRP